MSDVDPPPTELNAMQPKNLAVAARMREQLSEGRWSPGDQIPPARQLAQTFGVSLSPILQALQILEKEGLLVRRARVGTFVAEKQARKLLLGLIVSNCDLEPSFQALRGFEEEACRRGYHVVFCNANRAPESFAHRAEACMMIGCAGIAYIPPEGSVYLDWNRAFYRGFADQDIPLVAMCSQPFPDEDPAIVSAAVPDGHWQGRRIAAHLVDRGHRRIGFLYGRWSCVVEDRRQGVAAELAAHGLPAPEVRSLSPEERLRTGGSYDVTSMLSDWISATPPVSAVVCSSDYAARILYEHADGMGISIPDDIAVTGFDDSSFAALLAPPLTTVRISYADLGRSAAELLIGQLNDGQRPPRLLMSRGELMVRGSCRYVSQQGAGG